MKKSVSLIFQFLAFYCSLAVAQTPQVPAHMQFADINLKLTEQARKSIQEDVNALTRSPKYFNIKVERAKSYFPIIERIFKEEGVPDDFKYLVLQESALIADAVSSSQAVGFWQMKDYTALEFRLLINKQVDERMNIVSSTRAAAGYFKKANNTFNNWLNALQAYQMGVGGASRALGEADKGAHTMVINKNTYWYVKKYLAHKIAFEFAVEGPAQIPLSEYVHGANKNTRDLARETGVGEEIIKEYNKWLLKNQVPEDRTYVVILPGDYKAPQDEVVSNKVLSLEIPQQAEMNSISDHSSEFPRINLKKYSNKYILGVNGLPGIIAADDDNTGTLAKKGNINHMKFLKYNDMETSGKIIPGQVYYFKKKKSKAGAYYHTIKSGETLWTISQKYGLRLKKLKIKNRIVVETVRDIKPGRLLWLRNIRPENEPIKFTEMVSEIDGKSESLKNSELSEHHETMPGVQPQSTPTTTTTSQEETTFSTIAEPEPENQIATFTEPSENSTSESDSENPTTFSTIGLKRKSHFIKKGETLYSISQLHNVSVPELLAWNRLDISDKLSVGQKLELYLPPDRVQNDDTYKLHVVQKGDTMYKIAQIYGVEVQDLINWNNKKDTNLTTGERLKINILK